MKQLLEILTTEQLIQMVNEFDNTYIQEDALIRKVCSNTFDVKISNTTPMQMIQLMPHIAKILGQRITNGETLSEKKERFDLVKAFTEYLENTSEEQKKKDWDETKDLELVGPTVEEFFGKTINFTSDELREYTDNVLRTFRSDCLPFGEYPDYVIIEFLNEWFKEDRV